MPGFVFAIAGAKFISMRNGILEWKTLPVARPGTAAPAAHGTFLNNPRCPYRGVNDKIRRLPARAQLRRLLMGHFSTTHGAPTVVLMIKNNK
jgi:hypothetical protein